MTQLRLVLASASPRRRELLSRLGIAFAAVPLDVDEHLQGARPERLARRLAALKARATAGLRPHAAILAADTIVAYRNLLFGKPEGPDQARATLELLRGRSHRVVTAVAVLPPGRKRPLVDHATTMVTMRRYRDAEIAASIARGDPLDKAGAYAIQDDIFQPVESYDGCYCNVVGLPLWTAIHLLGRAGLDITHVRSSDLLPQCAVCRLAPVL